MALPTVSVVIPASRAADAIDASLEAIQRQDYSGRIDIVVAAADRATAAAAMRRGATVVENPTGSTPAGLNLAIAESNGDVIVRVDAHAEIPPDYVSSVVRILEDTGADNVGGMQVPVGRNFWERAIAEAMASPVGSGNARYRIGGVAGPVETVYLGAYPRSTLQRLGGFDGRFIRNQDFELNQRIRASGGVVWFDPSLRVQYRPRGSLTALARQYFGYGTWKRAFARVHPGSLQLRQIVPPALVLALIVALALSLVWPLFLLVPAGYLAGLVIAGVFAVPRARTASIGVPAALATMHLSWGLGFWFGQTRER